jgi:hypothetical protein
VLILTFAVGGGPNSVAVADVNGHFKPDLVVTNTQDNTVSVLLNETMPGSSTASFAAQQSFATGGGPVSVAVGDVNGDGRPDLLIANKDDNTVSVLLGETASVVLGTATATGTIQDDDAPVSVTPVSGDNQSASVNEPFAAP